MEKVYQFFTPGNFYPLEFTAKNKAEARAQYLRWSGRSRLPNGTCICVRNGNTNYGDTTIYD